MQLARSANSTVVLQRNTKRSIQACNEVQFQISLILSKGFFQSFAFDKSNIATRHVSKILHCPGFAFFSWLLQRDQAIARSCIRNFKPHKKMRLMWHLLKMQSNASPSEKSIALWITWMHRDNPPCKMQYMDYASQELHITRCKGPALLCNMQCIQDALQEAWITRCI